MVELFHYRPNPLETFYLIHLAFDKKYSFEIAKRDFQKDLWKPILTVEKMRQNWKPLKALPLINKIAEINPLLWYQINSRFFNISKISH